MFVTINKKRWAMLIFFIFICIYLTILPVSHVCTNEINITNDFIEIGNSITASDFSLLMALLNIRLEGLRENINIGNIYFFRLHSTKVPLSGTQKWQFNRLSQVSHSSYNIHSNYNSDADPDGLNIHYIVVSPN